MNRELLTDARKFIEDLLEQCEGELTTAVDLDTVVPNELGTRALRLMDRLDAELASNPTGIVQRLRALLVPMDWGYQPEAGPPEARPPSKV